LIFIWGPLHRLHPRIRPDTRAKCRAAGLTKSPAPLHALPAGALPASRIVVGVFENLHWSRYSSEYRRNFCDHVWSAARHFTQQTLLRKAHHVGLWLTRNAQYG